MALIARLHPVLVHFPIALVIIAAIAEAGAMLMRDSRLHVVAVWNARSGALFAVITAMAGWRLALLPNIESTSLLTWHRWLGTTGASIAVVAALAAIDGPGASARRMRLFQIALFSAASFVAVTGHLGGVLVWGADWFRL